MTTVIFRALIIIFTFFIFVLFIVVSCSDFKVEHGLLGLYAILSLEKQQHRTATVESGVVDRRNTVEWCQEFILYVLMQGVCFHSWKRIHELISRIHHMICDKCVVM
jgi:hypothetical protein